MNPRTTLQVNRRDVGITRLVTEEVGPLADGQVRIEIEQYAITANNITYGVFGDMLGYWDFYPVSAEWGNVPVMGWGRVTESNVDGIAVGGRYYGWWPMATGVDLAATPTRDGFRDDGAHRAAHAPAYRAFAETSRDPLYTDPDDEHRHCLLRGLFATGFLVEAFFEGRGQFGAEQSIVVSASAKTAIAYADCAHRRGVPHVIGLTSSANAEFVRALGVYDTVLTYDEVDQIPLRPSVVVDVAGSAAVAEVHNRLGDLIAHSMLLGKSHHDALPSPITAGPQPEMFFAPGEIEVRRAEWGAESYQERIAASLARFLGDSHRWLLVQEYRGPEVAQQAWDLVYRGQVGPDVGVIASVNP